MLLILWVVKENMKFDFSIGIVSEFHRTDDSFILRFLNARKNNVPDSFELMANYYSYRQRNRQLFDNFVAHDIGIQQALRDGFPGVLPERDRYG